MRSNRLREWLCRPKGSGNCYGPYQARTYTEARRFWREFFGTSRIEVWETTPKDREAIMRNYRETYHPMYACD